MQRVEGDDDRCGTGGSGEGPQHPTGLGAQILPDRLGVDLERLRTQSDVGAGKEVKQTEDGRRFRKPGTEILPEILGQGIEHSMHGASGIEQQIEDPEHIRQAQAPAGDQLGRQHTEGHCSPNGGATPLTSEARNREVLVERAAAIDDPAVVDSMPHRAFLSATDGTPLAIVRDKVVDSELQARQGRERSAREVVLDLNLKTLSSQRIDDVAADADCVRK